MKVLRVIERTGVEKRNHLGNGQYSTYIADEKTEFILTDENQIIEKTTSVVDGENYINENDVTDYWQIINGELRELAYD